MATDLTRAYQISKRAAAFAEYEGLEDDPCRIYATADEVWDLAERAYNAEQRGEVHACVFLVAMGATGRYEACTGDGKLQGCEHRVEGADLKWGRIYAVTEHAQRCVGRHVNTSTGPIGGVEEYRR